MSATETVQNPYFDKARGVALGVISVAIPEWSDAQAAAGADEFLKVGFGHPRMGFTGRWAANILRRVEPGLAYAPAVAVAGALNAATIELTRTPPFDEKPFRRLHCGERYNTPMTPKSHWGNHRTVFDPRTF